ncbi:putative DsbA family dithiol-disulfide isomerase [Mucilaginibacter gracilis]|uniref:Putative DsbA family dithiol-disulfide isomerase n=1 Tax=Mucilaginibacter gracilis TaxID=423350 RepID=A0A495J2D7_9SPHI|nr:DsbA family oxidoreductase [Mucilaginibacter gracilis]RKR82983.1 putative DsbA family dithiol-disulfide isomerase [Mucilaginibacter gracilis]
MEQEKLKVEIWSDVMCPFCYIGKRRFENALQQFEHKDNVEVIWKSYQLDPTMQNNTGQSLNQYLAERKGISVEQSVNMHKQMTEMAAELGLEYNFDKAIIANSFDAHRLSHLAKAHGLQDELEEALFKAYFTDGKNIANVDTLIELGIAVGLDADAVKQTLNTDTYAQEVKHDIYQANQVGVRGVPFFVLADKYAVSGAQQSETFLGALQQTWNEVAISSVNGPVCGPDGDC